ncbi:MAG: GDSL-type esterase/lipase family protein [Methylacidiphilales bacterium]|nr:GDSL-type esterase/lipase family protein [Candidatus Methylacidiphilales bacterium]
MKIPGRFILFAIFGLTLSSVAFADGTISWPPPTPPPGTNPAVFPVPRLDWLQHFQKNLDQAKKMAAVDLVFDGDSITDFWQTTGKDVWSQHYAKLNAIDFGISGDQTQHLLWRLQNGQVDGLHPKLIVLLIGTNNIGYASDQVVEGIKAIIGEYQKRCPDAAILLQGIFPRGETADNPARLKIKAINQTLAPLADGKKIIYLDFGDKFLQPDGTLTKDIMPDFLHPSAKGYQIWADAIQPVIDQFFGATSLSPSSPPSPSPQ